MPFQLSPGVAVVEKDFTSIVPAVASSTGAFVGAFPWGPVLSPVTISSENELVQRFGKPTDSNFQSFFTAANFLSYTNRMLVVRADTGHLNAVSTGSAINIKNEDQYLDSYEAGEAAVGEWAAKYPGALGNSLLVSMADAQSYSTWAYKDLFDSAPGTSSYAISVGANNASDELHIVVIDQDGAFTGAANTVLEKFAYVSKASDAKKSDGTNNYYKNVINSRSQYVWWMDHTTSVSAANDAWGVAVTPTTVYKNLEITGTVAATVAISGTAGQFTCGASTLAINDRVVISGTLSGDGAITGYTTPTTYKVSAVTGTAGAVTGFTLVTLAGSPIVTTAGTTTGLSFASKNNGAVSNSLIGGTDDMAATDGELQTGWAIFADDSQYDISLLPLGKASSTVATYVINNIAEVRLDCVVFCSPDNAGDVIIGNGSTNIGYITAYRDALPSSSYAVMDSGYKYQYDRYNDKYRWVPLNGDTAGTCARTDYTNDPWFSPGGLNRGQIKNVVKLATNPNKTERDTLYKAGVNPVVTFPGQGTVLFGDKTLLAKPSAFDRINVRRLFIVLEKAVATAAKFQLFEFNDAFTRAMFKNMVEPFLRDVQGRRGITDFVVKCDETNNTGEVIDRNEFVADIFIKPARSINFITLNFIAARTSINFNEIGA